MALIQHFIAGREVADAERTGPVFNPATGERQHDVAFASVAEVEQAIAAAAAALPGWRSTGLIRRADVFFRLRQLLKERTPELACGAHERARKGALRRSR
jgi:malonate-semialdehyde dehydrogenase (acetylating)/methylmalonate-semialdehyde dehydrogenase